MVPLPNFLVPNQGVAYTIFKGGKVVGIATKNGIQKGKKGKEKTPRCKVEFALQYYCNTVLKINARFKLDNFHFAVDQQNDLLYHAL